MSEEKENEVSFNDFSSQFPDAAKTKQQPAPSNAVTLTEMEIESIVYNKLKEGAAKTAIVSELSSKGVERRAAINTVEKYAILVEKEIEQALLKPANIIFACLGGLAAAVIGGLVWGWVGMATGKIYSVVAIGIGALCGAGVILASSGKRGPVMQLIAGLTSIVGVIFGTYYMLYSYVNKYAAENGMTERVGLFSDNIVQYFSENFTKMFGPYDYIFMAVAILTAWGIPKDGK